MSLPGSRSQGSLLDKLHYIVVMTFFVVSISILALFYIPLTPIISPFCRSFTKWYIWVAIRSIGYCIGLHVEMEGVSKLKSAPKGVIIMNHQSLFDFFMVCSVYHNLGDKIHTVSRKEVFYVWPLGYAMWRAGSLFIDRSSPTSAFSHLIAEASKIFSPSNPLKSKIIIFPEGTRNTKLDEFLQFKRGAFKVAAALDVPIIPIVCPPQIFHKHMQYFRPAKVVLKCLDPVRLNTKLDLDPQIDAIKTSMLKTYHKMMDDAGIERTR